MAPVRKKGQVTILEATRAHEQALVAAGLESAAVGQYEEALRRLQRERSADTPRVQVLAGDVQREVEEFQAAVRREFSRDAAVRLAFQADQPLPGALRELVALGRRVAREAAAHAAELIKFSLNAATVNHLAVLCDQLEDELGGPDPAADVRMLEERIASALLRIGVAGITFTPCLSTSEASPPPSAASTS